MRPTTSVRKWKAVSISIAALLATATTQSFAASAGSYTQNAVFLAKRFVASSSMQGTYLKDMLHILRMQYGIKTLFVNVGVTNPADGTLPSLINSGNGYNYAAKFLEAVKEYETTYNYTFEVYAMFNGTTEKDCEIQYGGATFYGILESGNCNTLKTLHLSDTVTRSNIVAEAQKFVNANGAYTFTGNGSLAARPWDGILLDYEPAGSTDTSSSAPNPPNTYNDLKTLVIAVRNAITGGRVAVAAPRIQAQGAVNNWNWSPAEYYYMAKYTKYLADMAYGMSPTSVLNYQDMVKTQTEDVLKAVSGEYGNWTPSDHPAPTNNPRVLIGFPGFKNPAISGHNQYETARYAAVGTLEGLSVLEVGHPNSLQYFKGAVMFQSETGCDPSIDYFSINPTVPFCVDHFDAANPTYYRDTSTTKINAQWSTDWWYWRHYWLGL